MSRLFNTSICKICSPPRPSATPTACCESSKRVPARGVRLVLYKTVFYVEVILHESILLFAKEKRPSSAAFSDPYGLLRKLKKGSSTRCALNLYKMVFYVETFVHE